MKAMNVYTHPNTQPIFINEVKGDKVSYSEIITAKRDCGDVLLKVMDSVRTATIKHIEDNYKLIGNYPKDLIND